MSDERSFKNLLSEAVSYFSVAGYTSEDDLQQWLHRLHAALEQDTMSDDEIRSMISQRLSSVHKREVDTRAIKLVPGASRYTVDRISPDLRAELDQRIFASVNLIKLNRESVIDKTLQRFAGWVSSVPAGGSAETDKRGTVKAIGKSVARLKFEARRVAIDQGHKLSSNIARTVATANGAIAAVWHSNWRQKNYNYRPDHKERDEKVYLIRGSWAQEDGLVVPGRMGYLDDITQPAEEPFCQCYAQYVTSLAALQRLNPEMLTRKGEAARAGTGLSLA